MATSQHRFLLSLEAGGEEACRRRRPANTSLYCYGGLRSQRKTLGFLPRAQGSEPSSSQATPPPQQQEQGSNVPSWAQPGSSDPPPWERKQAASAETTFEVPFYAYLLASAIVAVAAIGSMFEYVNRKPVFGVIFPDSPFYAPILFFFVFTGFPAAAFLWFKSIELADKAARDQDREDGFMD